MWRQPPSAVRRTKLDSPEFPTPLLCSDSVTGTRQLANSKFFGVVLTAIPVRQDFPGLKTVAESPQRSFPNRPRRFFEQRPLPGKPQQFISPTSLLRFFQRPDDQSGAPQSTSIESFAICLLGGTAQAPWKTLEIRVDARIQIALKIIEEGKASIQLSLAETSRTLGLSEEHLYRLFHREIGKTFRRHLRDARMVRARRRPLPT